MAAASKTFYAVLLDTTVFRCKSLTEVAQIEGALAATDTDLAALPSSLLVKLHNRVRPERPVTKFADRPTAEKRMSGVLDFLAKPSPVAQTGAAVATGSTSKATKAPKAPNGPPKAPKAPKAPKEPKVAGKRGAKVKEIAPETVATVVAMKGEGKSWPEICAAVGEPNNFVHRIRPLLRAMDPSLVKALGPNSPNYGKGPKPKTPRAPGEPRAKRVRPDSGVPVEAF